MEQPEVCLTNYISNVKQSHIIRTYMWVRVGYINWLLIWLQPPRCILCYALIDFL